MQLSLFIFLCNKCQIDTTSEPQGCGQEQLGGLVGGGAHGQQLRGGGGDEDVAHERQQG